MSDSLPLEGEDRALARVLARLGSGEYVRVGPGHDCAVVDVGAAAVVVTTDVLVDGVHFRLEACGAEAAAAKALLVNLSDLAAAAAVPVACEVGVVLPRDPGPQDALLEGLARGFARVSRRWGCPTVGGDTNVADGPLVLAVTALGRPGPGGVVLRSGAQPGDVLSVTGPVGGSLAGRHLDFTPRLEEARHLAQRGIPKAMMDISDGLGRDLPRLLRASDVGAVIEAERIPVHPDVAALEDGRPALDHALGDGEDFELLVAHAPLEAGTRADLEQAGVRLFEIGRVTPAAEGLTLRIAGNPAAWPRTGYDHLTAR